MTFDPATFRQHSRETWDGVASGWQERRAWLMDTTASVNDWLLSKADPQPGQTVLDLAAGTGDLGFAAARRTGPDGTLISTDFAPGMVEVARRVGIAQGMTGVDHRVMDAERMDLEDDSVDVILCRWAFMLMADPAAAFTESRRILRDGGRLAFAVWTTPDRNPWALFPALVLVQHGYMEPPDPEGPGIFSFGDPEPFTASLVAAGFTELEIQEITFEFVHPDFEDAWLTTNKLTGPLVDVIKTLSEQEVEAVHDEIEEALAPFHRDDGSYAIPASTWAVLAS